MEGKTLPSLAFFLLTFIAVLRANCWERQYLIVDKRVTFDEAVQLCLQYGMEIASPLSAKENITLAKALAEKIAEKRNSNNPKNLSLGIWIGARKARKPSAEFFWVNTGRPLLFSHFLSGQPDNYKNLEHCIHLDCEPIENLGWNDVSCNEEISFACQTRMVIELDQCG